ncbi:SDR family NAD(P)-dependent oxidoreductase [Nocardia sp. NPDC051570]|uniref:SDR family NAD(P)-dependent oxidoreductase n=1 Tax=Nocardia sp. NPDC051570 TaxID=3364324 RepID=UPI0037B3BECF
MTGESHDEAFVGKVAVVTGAGSGIGRALAVDLAGRGARLAVSDVDAEGLARTARLCEARGALVMYDRIDVTERDAIESYAAHVHSRFGIVHQIYNNAGIAYYGEVERAPYKDFERVLDVNFWGVVNGTKAFLPHLIESGDGHVVNVSSLFGLVAYPGQSAYTASKFAVRGFTEALAEEMAIAGHPVRVSCVYPGGIKTAVARNATVVAGADPASFARGFDDRLALHTPEMAARTVLDGVRGHRGRIVVGAEAKALDWVSRLTPLGARKCAALLARLVPVTTLARGPHDT